MVIILITLTCIGILTWTYPLISITENRRYSKVGTYYFLKVSSTKILSSRNMDLEIRGNKLIIYAINDLDKEIFVDTKWRVLYQTFPLLPQEFKWKGIIPSASKVPIYEVNLSKIPHPLRIEVHLASELKKEVEIVKGNRKLKIQVPAYYLEFVVSFDWDYKKIKEALRKGYGILRISPNLEFRNLKNKWIIKPNEELPIEIYIVNKGNEVLEVTLADILFGGCNVKTPDGKEINTLAQYMFAKDPEKFIVAKLEPGEKYCSSGVLDFTMRTDLMKFLKKRILGIDYEFKPGVYIIGLCSYNGKYHVIIALEVTGE